MKASLYKSIIQVYNSIIRLENKPFLIYMKGLLKVLENVVLMIS